MGWMSELKNVYDLEKDIVGQKIDDVVLLPMFHTEQNAHIEVTVFDDGTFSHAEEIEKAYQSTILPATEDSASRSSGNAPHALCDKLLYVAGDYSDFVNDNRDDTEYFEKYIFQLSKWINSDFSDPLIEIIFNYLKKGELIKDLIKCGILRLDESGKYLDKKYKLPKAKNVQTDSLIRFIVTNKSDNSTYRVWENQNLYKKYTDYCMSEKSEYDLCYITGEIVPVSYKHMSKIRYSGDKAKLLSSNDETGFTYRGRFSDDKEAYSVGKITSQKAHLALKWLIERQGTSIGSGKFVTWENTMQKVPDINKQNDLYSLDEDFEEELEAKTSAEYSRIINKAIKGYRTKLVPDSKIMVMFIDAASQGRLSILNYQEFRASEYYDNLNDWYIKVHWHCSYFKEKRRIDCVGTPIPKTIIECAYGVERGDEISIKPEALIYYIKQIYSSIIYGKSIPQNILTALFNRASNPLAYDKEYNWEKVLDVTCALYRKYYLELKKGGAEFNMILDKECNDRSYLYGRLAAVADKLEQDTFEKDEKRLTNTKRYMNSLINSPFKRWDYICERVLPYSEKLLKDKPGLYYYYEKIMQEIYITFNDDDYISNKKLDARFFMGFYAQREDLYTKKVKEEAKDDSITE